jgi:hypothetical protein
MLSGGLPDLQASLAESIFVNSPVCLLPIFHVLGKDFDVDLNGSLTRQPASQEKERILKLKKPSADMLSL